MNYKHILIVLLAFITFACTKGFDELEKDPTATSSNPNAQLSFIQLSMSGDRFYQWRANLIYAGGFVQHYAGSWNVTTYGSIFQKNDGYASALWRRAYANELKNAVDIIEKTKDDPTKVNINAIAKIMKVMIGQRITDLYGDVPYSEAGAGFSSGVVTPVYDKQEDIYNSFFADLEESQKQLNPSADKVTGDLFYGGNINKWKKLANTLRLRLGMRISEIKPAEAKKQVEAAFSKGVFTSNDDNCILHHDDIAFNGDIKEFRGNGLAQAFVGNAHSDHFSSLLIDFLRDNGDPRLKMLATPKTGSKDWGPVKPGEELYVGIKPGSYRWDNPGGSKAASGIQDYFKKNNTPFLHVSYSETELLLAEAAQRKWITGNAAAYYKKGVEAGIKQLGIYGATMPPQADIDAYLSAHPLKPATAMKQIATQLWVTYLFNSIEAYANQRRTGFPVLVPITNSASQTGGVMPRRLYYPNDELQKNEANYLDALSRIGGSNDWLKRVWWDVK